MDDLCPETTFVKLYVSLYSSVRAKVLLSGLQKVSKAILRTLFSRDFPRYISSST